MSSSDAVTARDRILDAALERFGRDGINRVTVRAIATEAGVSPALVVHHFGSKEALRQECDAYVAAIIRGNADATPDQPDAGDPSELTAALESGSPIRRYLARAFLDGTEQASQLFDEIVDAVADWLATGERDGWIRPSTEPRTRAVLYVSWLLAPLVMDQHIARALEMDDPHDTANVSRFAPVMVDMLTHGVFTEKTPFETWTALRPDDGDAPVRSDDPEHGEGWQR